MIGTLAGFAILGLLITFMSYYQLRQDGDMVRSVQEIALRQLMGQQGLLQ